MSPSESVQVSGRGEKITGAAAVRAMAVAAFLAVNPGFAAGLGADQVAVFKLEVPAEKLNGGMVLHVHDDVIVDGRNRNSSIADLVAYIQRQGAVAGTDTDRAFSLISDKSGANVVAVRIMPSGEVQEARVTADGVELISAEYAGEIVRKAIEEGRDLGGFFNADAAANAFLKTLGGKRCGVVGAPAGGRQWRRRLANVGVASGRIGAENGGGRCGGASSPGGQVSGLGRFTAPEGGVYVSKFGSGIEGAGSTLVEIMAESRLAQILEQMGVETREGELLKNLRNRIDELEKTTGALSGTVYRDLGITKPALGARLSLSQVNTAAESMLSGMMKTEAAQGVPSLEQAAKVQVVLHENPVSYDQALSRKAGRLTGDKQARAFVVADQGGFIVHVQNGPGDRVLADLAHEVGHIPTLARFGTSASQGASEMVVQCRIMSSPKRVG
ncbi:MAG: hypothetical protein IPN90_04235 [Elusimicrobia bacterium]|nr:hypothetical protein [Elusimicrobiota bacterium]